MEKRGLISLRGVLLRYLVQTVFCCVLALLLWFASLMCVINSGLALPANQAAQACQKAAQDVLPGMTAATFDETQLDSLCRYALFAAPDSSEVLATNMDAGHLQRAMENRQGKTRWHFGYTQYYMTSKLQDGTVCLLQFDYAVPYAAPALRGVLPDMQTVHCILGILLLVGAVVWSTHRSRKFLARETARLTEVSRQVAEKKGVEEIDFSGAQVREYAETLAALQTMGQELTASLQAQWKMEQQQREQIIQLSHELKTPLAVFEGNADLLAEDALSADQQTQVEAILRGTERARHYLAALRTAGAAPAVQTSLASHALTERLAQTARALCAPAGIHFILQEEWQGTIRAAENALLRAAENLLDNAAAHTPRGGTVTLTVAKENNCFILRVTDTGPGFTAAALARAGEMFYTDAARSGSAHQGLGLYSARRPAAAHGGTLRVSNTPGGCAELCLPICE